MSDFQLAYKADTEQTMHQYTMTKDEPLFRQAKANADLLSEVSSVKNTMSIPYDNKSFIITYMQSDYMLKSLFCKVSYQIYHTFCIFLITCSPSIYLILLNHVLDIIVVLLRYTKAGLNQLESLERLVWMYKAFKQCIQLLVMMCGVPQGSVFSPVMSLQELDFPIKRIQ